MVNDSIYLEHLGREKHCFCVLNLFATDLLNTIYKHDTVFRMAADLFIQPQSQML